MTEKIVLQRKPLMFTALKALCRSPLRGGDRLFAIAERMNLLRGLLRCSIDERHAVYVPIARRWDLRDLLEYESELVSAIADKARALPGEITLIDCGADIGLLSVLLLSKIDRITKVIAFEPNDDSHAILQKTLAEQPCESSALRRAVSDFSGFGELKSPDYDSDDEARYLSPVEFGGFPVSTVDDSLIERPPYCILKIDVEGGELPALMGARACIEAAKGVIVAVEAHPKVAARTGIDPNQVLRFLGTLWPFEFAVAELPDLQLHIAQPFFEQVEPTMTYNVVCSSLP
jgi:FkbM family methyltransferase